MTRLALLLTTLACLCCLTQSMTTTLEPPPECVSIGRDDGSFEYESIFSSGDPLDAICNNDPDVYGDYRKRATYRMTSNVGPLLIEQLSFEVRRVPDMRIVFDEGQATEVIVEIDIPDAQFDDWYEVDLEMYLPAHGISSIRISIMDPSVSNTRLQIRQICGVGCDEEMATPPPTTNEPTQPPTCPYGSIEADIIDTNIFEHVVPVSEEPAVCGSGIENRMRKRSTYKIRCDSCDTFILLQFELEVKGVSRVFMELVDDSGNELALVEGIVPVSEIGDWSLVRFGGALPVSGVARINIKQIDGTGGMDYREICGMACIEYEV